GPLHREPRPGPRLQDRTAQVPRAARLGGRRLRPAVRHPRVPRRGAAQRRPAARPAGAGRAGVDRKEALALAEKQILRAFGAQDDRLARSAKLKRKLRPTIFSQGAPRLVILSERAVRARSEGSIVQRASRCASLTSSGSGGGLGTSARSSGRAEISPFTSAV